MRSTLLFLLVSSCVLGLVQCRDLAKDLKCDTANPFTSVKPQWSNKPLAGRLSQWHFDGISPFKTQNPKINGNSISIPLVGRGSANPLSGVSFLCSTPARFGNVAQRCVNQHSKLLLL